MEFLGPLIEGEDPAAYDELLARVSGAVKPSDILEEIWVHDVVDLVWEALRLHRLKTDLIAANGHEGLEQILVPLTTGLARTLSPKPGGGAIPRRSREVDKLLGSASLSMDSVMAQTLALKLDQVERIDRMIMGAEGRRNAILREVDRHRTSVAQALRQAANNVENTQFEERGGKQIVARTAA